MRQESIGKVAPGAARGRAGITLAVLSIALASCAAVTHYAVRLVDWRSSVAAAHRGVKTSDPDEQLRSVVALHNAAREAVESLRMAESSPDERVRSQAKAALQRISESVR